MSGRKGLGVKIDDLLDLLTDKAAAEVATRNPELSEEERRRVATQIAVAAIRYFMLKYSRGKLIVFDIEEALSFEGRDRPVSAVCCGARQQHLSQAAGAGRADRGGPARPARRDRGGRAHRRSIERGGESIERGGESIEPSKNDAHGLWALVLEAARLDEIVEQVIRTLEFSVLAKYAFGLAQTFNAFYHRYPILNEERRRQETLARGRRGVLPGAARPGARFDGH